MAIYDIKTPDGRVISLKGDTMPTEQEIDEIVSRMSTPQTGLQRQLSGATALTKAPRELLGPEKIGKYMEEGARESTAKMLRIAQLAGQFGAPIAATAAGVPAPLAPYTSAPITAATEYGIQKLRGGKAPKGKALRAGVYDTAITGGAQLGFHMAKPVLRKVIPAMTGISPETVDVVLDNPKVFKEKINLSDKMDEAGKRAQKAAKHIIKKQGEMVNKEIEAIRGIKKKYDFSDLADKVDDLVRQKNFSGVQILDRPDIKQIKEFTNKIRKLSKKGMTADQLYAIQTKMGDKAKYAIGEVQKISSKGQGVLKQGRKILRKKLGEISPQYDKIAKKYKEIKDVYDKIQPKLKDADDAAVFINSLFKKDLATEEPVRLLTTAAKLDKLAPKEYKFGKMAKEVLAVKQFENWLPKKNLLHNIRLAGALGAGGVGGVVTGNVPLLLATLGLGASASPKVYQKLISRGVTAKALAKSPLTQGVARQTVTRLAELYKGKDKKGKK